MRQVMLGYIKIIDVFIIYSDFISLTK